MKKIYIAAMLLLGALPALGQQQLTPQAYRDSVLAYNQDIKIAQQQVEAAANNVKSANTGRLPKLNFVGDFSYMFFPPDIAPGLSVKPTTLNTGLVLTQNVFGGNAAKTQYQTSKLQQAIASLGEESSKVNIAYAADVNYWNTAAMRQLFQVSEEFYGIVEKLYGVVDKRFKDGLISRTDALMVETRKQEAALQISSMRKNYQIALQNLNVLMGAPAGAVVGTDSIGQPTVMPEMVTLEQALAARPEFQIAGQQIAVAEEQTKLVKSRFLPSLSVGAQATYGTKPLNIDNELIFNTIAFAKLNVPIFDWNNKRYSVGSARTAVNVLTLQQSKLADKIRLEYSNALTNMIQTQEQVDIATKSLRIAEQNLDLNTFSYTEGRLTILDVLSSQLSWLQAQNSLISAQLQHKIAIAEYRKAIGMQ